MLKAHDPNDLNPQKTITASDAIIRFLQEYGDSEFGKIQKYLKDRRYGYSERKSIHNLLDNLTKQNQIGRYPSTSKKGHYIYHITKQGQASSSLQGYLFGGALRGLLNTSMPFDGSDPKDEKHYIKKIITRVGFYMLYTQLQSWRFVSKNRSPEENQSVIHNWLANSANVNEIDDYLWKVRSMFAKNIGLPTFGYDTYMDDNEIKSMHEFERYLKILYPDEYELCKNSMNDLPKIIDQDKRAMKFQKSFDEWIKHLERKPPKPKNKLKPNECPRCHYDGIGPIKNGPSKGEIHHRGFDIRFTDESGKHIIMCGTCRYSEIEK